MILVSSKNTIGTLLAGSHRYADGEHPPLKAHAYTDTRPRAEYRLPDGTIVRIIRDHDELPPFEITVQLLGGKIVLATLV